MKKRNVMLMSIVPLIGLAIFIAATEHFPRSNSIAPAARNEQVQQPAKDDAPGYHNEPPRDPLPPLLAPGQFTDPTSRAAYSIARKIPEILYQVPCACPCSVALKHQSLFDCYRTIHGSHCEACKKEVFLCFEGRKRGLAPSEIRQQIQAREWVKVESERYAKAYLASQHVPQH